jgi:hypothetical protein
MWGLGSTGRGGLRGSRFRGGEEGVRREKEVRQNEMRPGTMAMHGTEIYCSLPTTPYLAVIQSDQRTVKNQLEKLGSSGRWFGQMRNFRFTPKDGTRAWLRPADRLHSSFTNNIATAGAPQRAAPRQRCSSGRNNKCTSFTRNFTRTTLLCCAYKHHSRYLNTGNYNFPSNRPKHTHSTLRTRSISHQLNLRLAFLPLIQTFVTYSYTTECHTSLLSHSFATCSTGPYRPYRQSSVLPCS